MGKVVHTTRGREDTLKWKVRVPGQLPKGPSVTKKSSPQTAPDGQGGNAAAEAAQALELAGLSFEQALADLEDIVSRMESGSLSLEDSLTAYKRGVALVARCRDQLGAARQQVRILEGDLLKPFDLDQDD